MNEETTSAPAPAFALAGNVNFRDNPAAGNVNFRDNPAEFLEQSPVSREIDRLLVLSDELHSVLDTVEKRFSPVLLPRDNTAKEGVSTGVPMSVNSSVTTALRTAGDRLSHLRARMVDFRENAEV